MFTGKTFFLSLFWYDEISWENYPNKLQIELYKSFSTSLAYFY